MEPDEIKAALDEIRDLLKKHHEQWEAAWRETTRQNQEISAETDAKMKQFRSRTKNLLGWLAALLFFLIVLIVFK